jgi:hypothetical protein
MIGLSAAFLLTIILAVVGAESQAPRLDPITLRDARRPLAGDVVILLDATDTLSPERLSDVEAWLGGFERSSLQPNERVSLWVLSARGEDGLEERFSRCFPGRETDPLLHNPARSAAACDSLFTEPLHRALGVAAGAPASRRSPILEAIRELSTGPELAPGGHPRHLILISDLLQNNGAASFYRRIPRLADREETVGLSSIQADLHGVEVTILYVPRRATGLVRASELSAYWAAFFRGCGASAVHLERA